MIASKHNVKPDSNTMKRDRIECVWRTLTAVLGALAVSALVALPLCAQTHKVAKQQDVVRAVGVYEWTGDMAKPAASRLIPVSLFIDGKLEDAAVYMASPVPFALLTGNVYELQNSGVAVGTLDLQFSRHLVAPETATTTYDDGWFGYGRFAPPAPPKKSTLKPVKTIAAINPIDEDDGRPHFSSRSATPGSVTVATLPEASAPEGADKADPRRRRPRAAWPLRTSPTDREWCRRHRRPARSDAAGPRGHRAPRHGDRTRQGARGCEGARPSPPSAR